MEHRVFNTLTLTFGAYSLTSLIQNMILHLHIMVTLMAGTGTVLMVLMYFISRFNKKYENLVWVLILVCTSLVAFVWFYGGGSQGGNLMLYLVMIFFFITLTKGLPRFLSIAWTIIVPVGLFFLEYLHPEYVISYQTSFQRFIDGQITFILVAVIMAIGTSQVVTNFHRERKWANDRAELLHKKKMEMDKELNMARNIQMNLIPMEYNSSQIAFFYQPMELVGGDFFDFIEVSQDELGIFVSDVAGHGVPAAFITSLIRSHTIHPGPVHSNPAEFLGYLNQILLNTTANHFVTAFYGIYNKKTRLFRYSSAGHPPPIIIKEKTAEFIKVTNNSFPLALFSTEEMKIFTKPLINDQVILEPGSKLLFYTDGLLETVNIKDKNLETNENMPFFEDLRLNEVLVTMGQGDCRYVLNTLVSELKTFRGTDYFDDDICIICMDIL